MHKIRAIRKKEARGRELFAQNNINCPGCGSKHLMLMGEFDTEDGKIELSIVCSSCRMFFEKEV